MHCAACERWTSLQRRARSFLVANNTRFLILPQGTGRRCLASRVLGLRLLLLARDWLALHGHALLLAETLVDSARFQGTCNCAANWIHLGPIQGRSELETRYERAVPVKNGYIKPLCTDW